MILCQEGYQGRKLVEKGLMSGAIGGVILSPRYHDPIEMGRYARELAAAGALVAVDPEFQLSVIPDAAVLKLAEYPYFGGGGLTRRNFTGRAISEVVSASLSYQRDADCSLLLSPTLELAGSRDWMSQVVLAMSEEAGSHPARAGTPLYVSLCLSEGLLASDEQVDELLDVVTTLDADGFYLVAARSRQDPMWSCPGADVMFGNLLYVVAILKQSGFEVLSGYSDLGAPLTMAAGAGMAATGWFKSQRHYCADAIVGSGFGRQPRKTYASVPLLSWVPLEPDMDLIRSQGLFETVMSGTEYDDLIARRDYEAWRREPAVLQLWTSLGILERGRLACGAGLRAAADELRDANQLYGRLRAANLPLEGEFGHLSSWPRAVTYAMDRLED